MLDNLLSTNCFLFLALFCFLYPSCLPPPTLSDKVVARSMGAAGCCTLRRHSTLHFDVYFAFLHADTPTYTHTYMYAYKMLILYSWLCSCTYKHSTVTWLKGDSNKAKNALTAEKHTTRRTYNI